MSKKVAIILMIIVAVVGSIFTFYGSNLLFSDVANMGFGVHDANIVASFPLVMIFCQFILGETYLSRYLRRPQYLKAMTKRYLVIFIAFSIVGLLTSLFSGFFIYHSFIKPYPFPAYCLVMIIVHLILIASAIYFYILANKRMKEDEQKRKYSFQYSVYTFFTVLLTYFAFERFGAFIYFPIYIQWRTFYLTWPFILSLLAPISMLTQSLLYIYEPYKKNALGGLIYAIANCVFGIGINIAVIIIGFNDSRMVSAISPAMALERLASLPVDIILTMVIMVAVGAFTLQYSIRMYLKAKKSKISEIENDK